MAKRIYKHITYKTMALHEHAERELRLAGFYSADSDYGGMLPDAVLELIDVFTKQGHSGGSAASVIGLLKTLASYKILAPITDSAEEWVETGNRVYQHKRLSAVFKHGENSKPYYLDAIVWKGEEPHDTFTGTIEGIRSRQYIRLPFMPKTFFVDVVKHYDIENYPADQVVEGAGKYVYTIKDRKQLDEVFSYYDKT